MATCLRHFVSHMKPATAGRLNNPPHLKGLPPTSKMPGLGLQSTMDKYGFGFLPHNLVDWASLRMSDALSTRVQMPEFRIRASLPDFLERQDANTLVDQILNLVDSSITSSTQGVFLMQLLVRILLQEYRKIALEKLFGNARSARPALLSAQKREDVEFSFQGLQEACGKVGVVIKPASGNRSFFKLASVFFDWTWTRKPVRFKRDHIESLSFRRYFHIILSTLEHKQHPHLDPAMFVSLLAQSFFSEHSALPYPDSNGSLSGIERKARKIFVFEQLQPCSSITSVLPATLDWHPDKHVKVINNPSLYETRKPSPSPAAVADILAIDSVKQRLYRLR